MEQLGLNKPHLLIMIGIPGSGKSYFANNFSNSFNAPIISDSLIRYKISDKPKYDKAEDELVNKITVYLLAEFMKTKQTIVYEGQSSLKADRLLIYKLCRDKGYNPLLVWVQTDETTAKKRFKKIIGDPLLAEDRFVKRAKQFCPPKANEAVVVISGKFTYSSQLKIVLKKLVDTTNQNEESKRTNEDRRSLFR